MIRVACQACGSLFLTVGPYPGPWHCPACDPPPARKPKPARDPKPNAEPPKES